MERENATLQIVLDVVDEEGNLKSDNNKKSFFCSR
nr:MAG TPA: hypothetical protein [Caudoviricetes sp.]